MLHHRLDWGAFIAAIWDWHVRQVHASYSEECLIRGVPGLSWYQCLGPGFSSCGVPGTTCCILEEETLMVASVNSVEANLTPSYILLGSKRMSL